MEIGEFRWPKLGDGGRTGGLGITGAEVWLWQCGPSVYSSMILGCLGQGMAGDEVGCGGAFGEEGGRVRTGPGYAGVVGRMGGRRSFSFKV
jgi:hypothetical protein